jgi:hypothetical protein
VGDFWETFGGFFELRFSPLSGQRVACFTGVFGLRGSILDLFALTSSWSELARGGCPSQGQN